MQLKVIYSITCKVSDNSPSLRTYNSTKGLVYITEHDIKNKESFKQGLRNRYNITEVTQALWIISKNIKSTPFLVTFALSNTCNNIFTRRKSSQSLPIPPAPFTFYKMLGVHAFNKELQKCRKVFKVWRRT